MKKQDKVLEDILGNIPSLLDRAISLMPRKGTAIKLYNGLKSGKLAIPFFEVDTRGIARYWKDKHPERGYPVTRRENITREEFLRWLADRNKTVIAEVHQNLLEYISEEASSEHKTEDSNKYRYPMGY